MEIPPGLFVAATFQSGVIVGYFLGRDSLRRRIDRDFGRHRH